MGEDVLKRPVHLAILKPTHIQKLAEAGKLPHAPFGVDAQKEAMPLPAPVAEKPNPFGLERLAKPHVAHSDVLKKNKKQLQLRVIHDRVPPLPADKIPPCNTCKTAACCSAFAVNISKEEYESGMYGDAAIELTPDMYKQLKSKFLIPVMFTAPHAVTKTSYFLEGKVGEACPFLTADKRCGIYDIRPVTCRTYTCIGDSRITEGMRQGTESLDPLTRAASFKKTNAE